MRDALAWLLPLSQQLTQQIALQRMPHALLLSGAQGSGRMRLATTLAQRWLCRGCGDALTACGLCRDCQLFVAGTHPDVTLILPGDNGRIGIDDVRAAQQGIVGKPMLGGQRVILIRGADRMTENAANALLKTLEEPPAGVLMLLLCEQRDALLPTISSRCQHWSMPRPTAAQWHDAVNAVVTETQQADAQLLYPLIPAAPLAAVAMVQDAALMAVIREFDAWRHGRPVRRALAEHLAKQGVGGLDLLLRLLMAYPDWCDHPEALRLLRQAQQSGQAPGRNLVLVLNRLLAALEQLHARRTTTRLS